MTRRFRMNQSATACARPDLVQRSWATSTLQTWLSSDMIHDPFYSPQTRFREYKRDVCSSETDLFNLPPMSTTTTLTACSALERLPLNPPHFLSFFTMQGRVHIARLFCAARYGVTQSTSRSGVSIQPSMSTLTLGSDKPEPYGRGKTIPRYSPESL